MSKYLTRLKFHTFRFKTELITGIAIVVSFNAVMSLGIPDDPSFIAEYVDIVKDIGIDALLESFDANAPGFLFWNSLMLDLYIYFTLAIIAIRIGSRHFPTKDRDMLEMTASAPKSSRKQYLDTYFSGLLVLLLIILASFFTIAIAAFIVGSADVLDRFAITHLFLLIVGLFFMSLTSVVSVFRFNKGSGDKVGYLYLVFSFFLQFAASSPDVPKEISYISVDNYVKPTSGLIYNDWNWTPFFVVLGICVLLFVIGYWKIKTGDYNERVKPVKSGRLDFIPTFSSRGKFAQKNPILFDQLRNDKNLFFIWTAVVMFFLFYVVVLYDTLWGDDPSTFENMLKALDLPMMRVFSHGEPMRYDYIGFLGFEYYGLSWIYFGLFLMFPSISAANRDYRNDEQDILWTNKVSPNHVMKRRSIAIAIEFYIMFSLTNFALLAVQAIFNIEADPFRQFLVYLVGLVFFTGVLLLLQGITMLFHVSKGRTYAMWFFFISMLLMITGFIVESVSFLKYFAFTYYYNSVGLLYGNVPFLESLGISVLFVLASGLVYFAGLRKFQQSNLS